MVDVTKTIIGAISIIIGLVMLPLVAWFISEAKTGQTYGSADTMYNETPVANITGLTAVLDLIAYGFAFGLVGLGVGMIYVGFKK